MQSRGYADEMKLTFAAANQVFYDAAEVRQIDVPTLSGAFGILPKHVPTLAVLQPGVVQVYEKDGTGKKFFVSSGTVTVNNDSSVQVLAEEAHPLESLDAAAARDVLQKSQQELSSATSDVVSSRIAARGLCFRMPTNLPSPISGQGGGCDRRGGVRGAGQGDRLSADRSDSGERCRPRTAKQRFAGESSERGLIKG